MSDDERRCPVTGLDSLPGDGTPLHPSPRLAELRAQATASPLTYGDGHQGLIVTRYDLARAVLEDRRFSMHPSRMPRGPQDAAACKRATPGGSHGEHEEGEKVRARDGLDPAASRSQRASLLSLDGDEHARLRRAVTSRFSVKQVRGRREQIAETVATTLAAFRAEGSPGDLWRRYAQPISARMHCHVLGVPEDDVDRFVDLFVGGAPAQAKYDFIREVVERRQEAPGEDVVSDLVASDVVSREEAEGLLFMLMSSGRDSVAYLITTAAVALLTHPDQMRALREDPALMGPAIEEFMRVGAMFLTLFPRTATEDVELDGVTIPAGTTVSVSSVAANRDPRRWGRPEDFDVARDAFGHLGFGHGIHGCIGQQLARAEIREALTQLLTEMPDLRIVDAEQLKPMPFAHPVATYEAGALLVAWD